MNEQKQYGSKHSSSDAVLELKREPGFHTNCHRHAAALKQGKATLFSAEASKMPSESFLQPPPPPGHAKPSRVARPSAPGRPARLGLLVPAAHSAWGLASTSAQNAERGLEESQLAALPCASPDRFDPSSASGQESKAPTPQKVS